MLQKETRYFGYFLMDSGLKIKFDITKENAGEEFEEMIDAQFTFEKDSCI